MKFLKPGQYDGGDLADACKKYAKEQSGHADAARWHAVAMGFEAMSGFLNCGEPMCRLVDLAEMAADFCTVQTHDDSTVSIAVSGESLIIAQHEGELVVVNDMSKAPDGPNAHGEPSYVLCVNDHGNQTLYGWGGEWVEIWSVV